MTAASQSRQAMLTEDLETLRNAQMVLSAAIQHAREEALEPGWRDQILGLRLRLEKTTGSNHRPRVGSTRGVRLSDDL